LMLALTGVSLTFLSSVPVQPPLLQIPPCSPYMFLCQCATTKQLTVSNVKVHPWLYNSSTAALTM
jgi:hypothetical protein